MIDNEEFQAMIMAQFARLAQQAGVYIRRLSNADRHYVLSQALATMEIVCEDLDPAKMSVLDTWDFCLQQAIRHGQHWHLRHIDGWRRTEADTMLAASPWGGL